MRRSKTVNEAHREIIGSSRTNRRADPFRRLDRMMALLYGALAGLFANNRLIAYRQSGTALLPGRPEAGADSFRPLSRGRSRAAAAMEQSIVLRALSALTAWSANCPTRVYGLFFMVYSLVGITVQAVGPMVWSRIVMSNDSLILFFTLLVVSAPLTLTGQSPAQAFGTSRLGRGLLCGLLGVPEERLNMTDSRSYTGAYYIFITLAVLCGLGTVWMPPLLPLWCLLGLSLVGLVLSMPEVGVSLSCLLLPLCWVMRIGLYAAVGVILLTWVGFGFHALSLHRTFRFGRLDGAVTVLGIIMTLNAFLCPSDWRTGLIWAILLSDYLLVVNLMNTRAAIRRCLTGVVLSSALVLLLGAARRIPPDLLLWMDSHWLGARFAGGFAEAIGTLRALPYTPLLVLMTLLFPWPVACLSGSRRPLGVVFWLLFCAGGVVLLYVDGTLLHVSVILIGALLFCLFFSHRTLTVTVCAAPLLVGGGIAARHLLPVVAWTATLADALHDRWTHCMTLWPDVWRMILRRPAGVGLDESAFSAAMTAVLPGVSTAVHANNIFLDFFAALGWPGAGVILLIAVLFLRKGLSSLAVCHAPRDRAWIAAGLSTACCFAGVGFLYSYGPDPALFFTLVVLLGVCSAHQSVVFDEQNLANFYANSKRSKEELPWHP